MIGRTPWGFTLPELMVAMAVISIAFAVSAVAFSRAVDEPVGREPPSGPGAQRQAVHSGRLYVDEPDPADGPVVRVLYLPDGRVVGALPEDGGLE